MTKDVKILGLPTIDIVHEQIRQCVKCNLCNTRTMAVPGEGPSTATIMFVGEAPGHVNDQVGRPFVGQGGRIFDSILSRVGISRQDVFITNAVKCWPPNNRKPQNIEIEACKSYLDQQIIIVKPRVIFALGTTAFNLLTGEKIKLHDEHGKIVYRASTPVCALLHPNGIRYIKGGMQTIVDDISGAIMQLQLSQLVKTELTQGKLFE